MIRLNEFFHSIQGEGKYAGRNAIFFRFSGCNLSCPGFENEIKSSKDGSVLKGCDTIRAVKFSHFKYENIESSDELMAKISALNLAYKPIIVITGGEPLLNYKDEIFYSFVKNLLKSGYQVHFETNGTIEVDFDEFGAYRECVFAISPKLSNCGELREKRLNFAALKAIKDNAKDSFYKFVLNQKPNLLAEIAEIYDRVPNEIYCMPLGKNSDELAKNAKFVFNLCVKEGFNYSDRVHIRVFDDMEGV